VQQHSASFRGVSRLGLLPVTTTEFLQEETTATTPILGAKKINQKPINELF
jgi:hypothetical protein